MARKVWDAHAKDVRDRAKKHMQLNGWNNLVGSEREERWLEARAIAEKEMATPK